MASPASEVVWRRPLLAALQELSEGNFARALPHLERAHRLGPEVPEVCLAYGRELLRCRDERGVALLEHAHQSAPLLTSATYELARHWAARGNFDEAHAVLRTGLGRHPQDPLLWIAAGETALDAGDFEGAEAAAHSALARCREEASVASTARALLARCANHHGLSLVSQDEFSSAVFAFKRAHDLDPNWPAALINMGAAFTRMGRRRRALQLYQQAEALEPDNALVAYNIGLELMALENWSRARHWLERSTELFQGSDLQSDKELAQAHRHLARVYLQLGADARAVRSLEVASHLAGAGADIWAELAQAHIVCGELSKAKRAARIALALAPSDERVRQAWTAYARAKNRRRVPKTGRHDSP